MNKQETIVYNKLREQFEACEKARIIAENKLDKIRTKFQNVSTKVKQ